MSIQFGKSYKITAYRQKAARLPASGALATKVADYFDNLPNGIEITQLRMSCKIEKTLKDEPNTCEIVIYNLNEQSRSEFERLPLRVKIDAGYQDAPRLLFVGDVRKGFVRSRLTGVDWETRLQLGDGLRAYAEARVNRTYKKGTPVRTIVRDVARTLDLDLPRDFAENPVMQTALASGEVVVGWAVDELTRVLAPYGYSWSIQNGALQVLKDEGGVRVGTEREIGKHTGMIDTPAYGVPDKNGKTPSTTVKHLLYPEVIPGERIKLYTLDTVRSYKVIRVAHTLDTDTDDWTTEIEALPL